MLPLRFKNAATSFDLPDDGTLFGNCCSIAPRPQQRLLQGLINMRLTPCTPNILMSSSVRKMQGTACRNRPLRNPTRTAHQGLEGYVLALMYLPEVRPRIKSSPALLIPSEQHSFPPPILRGSMGPSG